MTASHQIRRRGLYPRHNRRVPHTPDFLCSFVGSLNFLRLSLKRAAHAILSRAAYRKFGASCSFFARCGIPQASPSSLLQAHGSTRMPRAETPRGNPPTLSDCSAVSFRFACRLADPVEIHSRGLDAVHPRHHCPKQRSDDQAVKQHSGADGDQ